MKLLLLCVVSLLAVNVRGINNGQLAPKHEHQYTVAVITKDKSDRPKTVCSGSIIHAKYILTAAHCFTYDFDYQMPPPDGTRKQLFKDLPVVVYANAVSCTKNSKTIVKKAKGVYLLPDWIKTGVSDDIAVLELRKPFKFNEEGWNLQRINLPKIKKYDLNEYIDKVAVVSGFGIDLQSLDDIFKNNKNRLRRMFTKIDTFKACQDFYPKEQRIWKEHRVLCGKAVEKVTRESRTIYETPSKALGTCGGDSGGPLVLDGEVIGVLSRSKYGDDRKIPGIYMRVSHYQDFIEKVLSGQLETNSATVYRPLKTNTVVGVAVNTCARLISELWPEPQDIIHSGIRLC